MTPLEDRSQTCPFVAPDRTNELMEPFWAGVEAGELRLPRCTGCGAYHWFPKRRCPTCGSATLEWHAPDTDWELFTWVGVQYDFRLPYLEDAVPYITGLVVPTVAESIRLAALLDIDDSDRPEIGSRMRIEFRPCSGSVDRMPVFVPTEEVGDSTEEIR